MAILTIGGVDMPTPSELQIGYMDISKAERNAKGNMIIERINTKVKLEIKYAYITPSDLTTVLNAISPTYYWVTYLDAQVSLFKNKQFYCGDRTIGFLDYVDDIVRYKDFTFNLIEL